MLGMVPIPEFSSLLAFDTPGYNLVVLRGFGSLAESPVLSLSR